MSSTYTDIGKGEKPSVQRALRIADTRDLRNLRGKSRRGRGRAAAVYVVSGSATATTVIAFVSGSIYGFMVRRFGVRSEAYEDGPEFAA